MSLFNGGRGLASAGGVIGGGGGAPTYTAWAAFIVGAAGGDEGDAHNLTSTGGLVASARSEGGGLFRLIGWVDLRRASTALLGEMWESLASGTAPVPQSPHASTGGLVLPADTTSPNHCVAGMVGVSLRGAGRRLRSEIVWDVVSDGDIATNKGFGFGARARGLADSASLLGGGLSKASANNYRPTYFSSSLTAPSVSQGAALAVTMSNGTTITTAHGAEANGDVPSGTSAMSYGLCLVATQTDGGASASATSVVSRHTERTDLQPVLFNAGVDGDNIVRAIRVMIDGLLAPA